MRTLCLRTRVTATTATSATGALATAQKHAAASRKGSHATVPHSRTTGHVASRLRSRAHYWFGSSETKSRSCRPRSLEGRPMSRSAFVMTSAAAARSEQHCGSERSRVLVSFRPSTLVTRSGRFRRSGRGVVSAARNRGLLKSGRRQEMRCPSRDCVSDARNIAVDRRNRSCMDDGQLEAAVAAPRSSSSLNLWWLSGTSFAAWRRAKSANSLPMP
jgi:hypothetical protein